MVPRDGSTHTHGSTGPHTHSSTSVVLSRVQHRMITTDMKMFRLCFAATVEALYCMYVQYFPTLIRGPGALFCVPPYGGDGPLEQCSWAPTHPPNTKKTDAIARTKGPGGGIVVHTGRGWVGA